MALSLGIVGLPNVGKSTMFQTLTQKEVDIANYPFCTIDPNVGIVQVPDERLQQLTALFSSKKTISTIIEFVDIAGLVRGANKGEGLGNKFLANIREVDAICQVVRCFENTEIAHVDHTIHPLRDIETVNTELILKDLETLEKRLQSIEKEVRAQKKGAAEQQAILLSLQDVLSKGTLASKYVQEHEEAKDMVQELQLLSGKPLMYVLNAIGNVPQDVIDALQAPFVIMDMKEEQEAATLSNQEKAELGVQSKLPQLIATAYELLSLITFFTTGEDETRAWTVKKGATAPEAGAVIHSDFQEKFIKALIVPWDTLVEVGGYVQASAQGLVRTEGKEYVVQDGDVIEIKHG
jgi:ribosome-binding ATPase